MLTVNFTWPAAALAALGREFAAQGHGRILVLSSVAGYRIRRSNFLYGSSKAGLDGFAQGLGESLRGSGVSVPIAPLALWPLGFLYGAAVVPVPGGGGAVEMAFRAALGDAIPARLFGAALVWWRFYTFYIYILLGALAAGGTVMRAVRRTEDYEAEVETGPPVVEAA